MVNVLDSAVFPISVSGGGVYRTLINEETILTDSGYYYSNSLASDINVDAGSLTSGKQVLWFNDSLNDVVFSGLTSIGGVTIPENQGVKVAPNNYIEFTVDSTGVITKNRGEHTIDWIAGYTPPFQTFTYVSNGDTNDLFYYLGATKYNSSFINPHDRGEINVTASSFIDTRTPKGVTSRNNLSYQGAPPDQAWRSGDNVSPSPWVRIQFIGKTAKITRISIWAGSNNSTAGNMTWQGSNDGETWTNLLTGIESINFGQWWTSGIFASDFYSYYRLLAPNGINTIGDIQVYGEY